MNDRGKHTQTEIVKKELKNLQLLNKDIRHNSADLPVFRPYILNHIIMFVLPAWPGFFSAPVGMTVNHLDCQEYCENGLYQIHDIRSCSHIGKQQITPCHCNAR